MSGKLKERFDISYENSASASYLLLSTSAETKIITYQLEMISKNPNPNILPMEMRQKDDNLLLYYKITSKVPLMSVLKRKKLKRNEFIRLLLQIARVLQKCKGYLLDDKCFILNEEYIYINPLTFEVSMVYVPVYLDSNSKNDLKDFVIRLIMFKTDIEEKESDNFLQRILGNIKNENFEVDSFCDLLMELNAIDIHNAAEVKEPIKEIESKGENVKLKLIKPEKKLTLETKTVPTNERAYNKSNFFRIVLSQIFVALLIIILITLVNTTVKAEEKLTSSLALVLIVAPLDFLILRKLFEKSKKENSEEVIEVNDKKVIQSVPEKSLVKTTLNKGKSKNSNVSLIQKNLKTLEQMEEDDKGHDLEKPVLRINETVLLGSSDNRLAYLQGNINGILEKIQITKQNFLIGRIKDQVDYIIENRAVGKFHAEVISKNGLFYIKDMNSQNGTYINNIRISSNKEYEISNNDKISFANNDYLFIIPA